MVTVGVVAHWVISGHHFKQNPLNLTTYLTLETISIGVYEQKKDLYTEETLLLDVFEQKRHVGIYFKVLVSNALYLMFAIMLVCKVTI